MRTDGVYHRYMPLPRFHRLPPERQRAIIDAAKVEFAHHGPEGASYNTIIANAGISKSSAYQYFDGKEDILALVLSDVSDRLRQQLGVWAPADTSDAFWTRLRENSAALVRFLRDNPLDRALADAAIARMPVGDERSWLGSVLANGVSLGIVRADVDSELLTAASTAVLRAGDHWALTSGGDPDQIFSLLAGLWGPRA
ncbi:TetR/AcrR family transcriptional regulator [Nocardia asiatica]|uniref:TetR/AcrR family transcriptional regulator n=1 Tax=Nocardia asiatica TaxID=209252 RepID=UPI003EE2DA19